MAEDADYKSKISIWWDIENCHVPKEVDPHSIAQNLSFAIRRANFTGPIEINVFGDTNILPYNTQMALNDTGITLTHVPRGNKDAADKAILVSMLLWALDNSPPANILLISGDGDFAPALNRLKLKRYTILLACPAQFVKPALIRAAKVQWCWNDLAKGQLLTPGSSQSNDDSSQDSSVSSSTSGKSQQESGSSGFQNPGMYPVSSSERGSPQKKERPYIPEQTKVSNNEDYVRFSSNVISRERRAGSHGADNMYAPLDRRNVQAATNTFSQSGLPNFQAHQSQSRAHATERPHAMGSVHSRAHSMDRSQGSGHRSYVSPVPPPAESVDYHPFTSSGVPGSSLDVHMPYSAPQFPQSSAVTASTVQCDTEDVLKPPSTPQVPQTPAGQTFMGFPKHVPPEKPSCDSSSNDGSSNTYPPWASAACSRTSMQDLEDPLHERCVNKIYSAMKTLEGDMLVPTETNIVDCIQYWDPLHEKVNVRQTLIKAAERGQVTKTQLGTGLAVYLPPEHKTPWSCIDPGNMHCNYPVNAWLELQQFLLNGERKQAFLVSCSQYDAAQILKGASNICIKDLVVGKIVNLLLQAMQRKNWLRKSRQGWGPLSVNIKNVSDYSESKNRKGDMKRSKGADFNKDKEAILNKLRSWLPRAIDIGGGSYDLNSVPRNFELAMGAELDHQKLGFTSLQELMKELSDVVNVHPTKNGCVLYLAKQNGNIAGLNKKGGSAKSARSEQAQNAATLMQDNDAAVRRQIHVVRDLKLWLGHLMTVVQGGYDITKIREDYFLASGNDLEKEGLSFNKLQGILKQFPDVVQICRTALGIWVIYPAGHKIGDPSKTLDISTLSIH